MKDKYKNDREYMVKNHIVARGIENQKVLDAMAAVRREEFIPAPQQHYAYNDNPLPIGKGQTISQPYIVAYMTELLELEGTEKVLELGTGSGYQTAVLAEIAQEVYTVEVIQELGAGAQDLLVNRLDYTNIFFTIANGRDGWQQHAPYDRIILTASPSVFPQVLFDQLAEGGIAVAPVGDYFQRMLRYRKIDNVILQEALIAVSFVPFV
ncbi:MAG: protein-L-isoaspartate(D-aspartate) O-methyltransferase [bacterium]|nr:protein-L-isoaspartate(D-aspartate) O-methyltransferase [bacterium]